MINAKFVAAPAAASAAANDNRQAPRIVRATPPVAGRTPYRKLKRPVLNANGTPNMELENRYEQPSILTFAGYPTSGQIRNRIAELHDAELLKEAA
jgi:hypothetical protein